MNFVTYFYPKLVALCDFVMHINGLAVTLKLNITMKFVKKIYNLTPYFILIVAVFLLSLYIYKTFDKNLEIYDSISTGIISGIITALLLFVFQIIWKNNIVVWVENLLYQDVCIEGEWSGIIVPYIGLDTIDKFQKDMAWRAFRQRVRDEKLKETKSTTTEENNKEEVLEAEIVENENDTDTEKSVTAEVLINDDSKNNTEPNTSKNIKVEYKISPTPIIIRAEIKRSGHNISGRIIEIGGASKIHSYNICGTFKNLILAGTYETFSKDHMDRGAFSLMLIENGKTFEGFFSSYSDSEHKVSPMQCTLSKRHINNTYN